MKIQKVIADTKIFLSALGFQEQSLEGSRHLVHIIHICIIDGKSN
jgi:hypothetical protein